MAVSSTHPQTSSPQAPKTSKAPGAATRFSAPQIRHGVVLSGVYRDHRGAAFRVMAVARNEDGNALHVVYAPVDGQRDQDPLIRPLIDFLSTVDAGDGASVPRFLLISV